MSKFTRLGHALYEGDVSVDFVGRKWTWYAFSAVILTIAILGLSIRGLNWGIEFEGGVEFKAAVADGQATQQNVDKVRAAIEGVAQDQGIENAADPIVNTSTGNIRVQVEPLSQTEQTAVRDAIESSLDIRAQDVSLQSIGPSWGAQVAQRAVTDLVGGGLR